MIQRIQTLYLIAALAIMSSLYFLTLGLLNTETGELYSLTLMGIKAYQDTGILVNSFPLIILVSVIALINLVIIFLYKNRRRQMRWTLYNMILMIGTVGLTYFYFWVGSEKFNALNKFLEIPAFLPLVAALLNYLAFRNILKDENLVRSYDRIR